MAVNSAGNVLTAARVLTAIEFAGANVGFRLLPTISRTDVAVSNSEVSTSLMVPLGAVITQAVVQVAAAAPGTTTIGGIAAVRASAGEPSTASDQLVVDFGTLRTVSALAAPKGVSITGVTAWAGTTFVGRVVFVRSSGNVVTFTELQTERLLVNLSDSTEPGVMADDGLVTTTTPPADLALTVAGDRVWFRVGPVPADFTEDVDVTAAVQAAVDTAAGGDAGGNVAVRLALTARVPGELGLTLPDGPRFLRTHTVTFPGGLTTPVVFAEEGVVDLELPLPQDAPGWTIHHVLATAVPRDPGPLRVLPPDAPVPSTEADLLLDTDRRLVVRLPRSALARFERVAGVRLLLETGADGIEIGGALLTGSADLPGEPVPDAGLTPVSLPAAARGWASVPLAQPLDLASTGKPAPDDYLWVAIAVTRGSARLGLAGPGGSPDDRAVLRRLAPNGLAKPLSVAFRQRSNPADVAVQITADAAALRVIGNAPPAAPVDVVEVDVAAAAGAPGGTVRQSGSGGSTAITLDPVGPRAPLLLRLTATAGTTVTVGPVVVAYTQTAESGVTD